MYQVFTPADLLAPPQGPPRPTIAISRAGRAVFQLLLMGLGSWVAVRAGSTLQRLCDEASGFAGNCSGSATMQAEVFRYANWAFLLGTIPVVGTAVRRWWAWVAPALFVVLYAAFAGVLRP